MDEFSLIDDIVNSLDAVAKTSWVSVGSGDDATVISVSKGAEVVSSIDTFTPGIHFPTTAPAKKIGYRAFMAAASDLAAMAALPRYALVALSLPRLDRDFAVDLCNGMSKAAAKCDMAICGGNLTKGPLSITVSVHGEVNAGESTLRSGAAVGDLVQVSGDLGAAAACVRSQSYSIEGPLQRAYFEPRARVDLRAVLAGANAAIDVSDGCLQDLGHILKASKLGAAIESASVPVAEGAELQDALWGGDDYELLATAPVELAGFAIIGVVTTEPGLRLDGQKVTSRGYDHFRA